MSKKYKKLYFKKNNKKIKSVNKFEKNNIIKYENEEINIDFLEWWKKATKRCLKLIWSFRNFLSNANLQILGNMRTGFAECDILMTTMVVKRGDIFYADLSPVVGSEQGGIRPVIIIQNDIGNKYSPTVIVSAITSQINKAKLPTHVEISSEEYGLNRDSVVLLEQIRTLDKRRLKEKIGHMTDSDMKKVNKALLISLNLEKVN